VRRCALGMARKRRVRCRAPRFKLKGLFDRPRHTWATASFAHAVAGLVFVVRALAGVGLGFALARRRKIDAGASDLGQSDGDRLLGRPGAVLAAANLADLQLRLANACIGELIRLLQRREIMKRVEPIGNAYVGLSGLFNDACYRRERRRTCGLVF